MRIDRLLTLGVFHQLSKWKTPFSSSRIPILMYHSISDSSYKDRHPYFHTHTSPGTFRHQMDQLKETGYSVLSLSDAVEKLMSDNVPPKTAVITFDDGFRDFIQHAYPVLSERGFTATLFVSTGLVGRRVPALSDRQCLSWDEIALLGKKDFEIGSHTINHVKLSGLSANKMEYEIIGSKDSIEDQTGLAVKSFSCPYAFPEWDIEFLKKYSDLLTRAGYRQAVSTMVGRSSQKDGRYYLKRIPVNDHDDDRFFKAKLEGGYDWLYSPQSFSKKFRRSFN